MTNSFSPLTSGDELVELVKEITLKMIYVAIAVFVAAVLASLLWNYTSSNQVQKLKNFYF